MAPTPRDDRRLVSDLYVIVAAIFETIAIVRHWIRRDARGEGSGR